MTTINWTAGTGAKIEITFNAMFMLTQQGIRKTSGEKEVVVVAKVDGKQVAHCGLQAANHPVAVAMVGPIGLTAINRDLYEAAHAAVEAEIAEHNAACYRHKDALNKIDAECDALTMRMAY